MEEGSKTITKSYHLMVGTRRNMFLELCVICEPTAWVTTGMFLCQDVLYRQRAHLPCIGANKMSEGTHYPQRED